MDRSFNKLQIFITALLIGVLFSSCTFQEVEVTGLKNVSVSKVDKKGMDINLSIEIENPNNFSFTVERVKADIYANNIFLGKIKNYKNLKILKESKETYPLSFRLEFKELKENYMSALKTLLKRKADIRVKGSVKAKKFIFSKKIYFDESGTYKFLRFKDLKNLLQW